MFKKILGFNHNTGHFQWNLASRNGPEVVVNKHEPALGTIQEGGLLHVKYMIVFVFLNNFVILKNDINIFAKNEIGSMPLILLNSEQKTNDYIC